MSFSHHQVREPIRGWLVVQRFRPVRDRSCDVVLFLLAGARMVMLELCPARDGSGDKFERYSIYNEGRRVLGGVITAYYVVAR